MKKTLSVMVLLTVVLSGAGIVYAKSGNHDMMKQQQGDKNMMSSGNTMMNKGMMGMGMMGDMSAMMKDMKYNMKLHQYLGLHEEAQKMQLKMQKIMLDVKEKSLDLKQRQTKINGELDTLLAQTEPDTLAVIKLIQENEKIHTKIMAIHSQAMEQKHKLMVAHRKNVLKKTQAWVKKSAKDKTEQAKFVKFLLTATNSGMMNGMGNMDHMKGMK